MCVSSSVAKFEGTIGYMGEAEAPQGLVHVIGYQNSAANLSSGPNSMILHFPSKNAMDESNVIDVGEKGKSLLNDWVEMYAPKPRGITKSVVSNKVEIFNTGIYTVAISNKPSQISSALESVPENKRPNIEPELLKWYEDSFPGWSVAVCCFDNNDMKKSEPLFWWYHPIHKERIHFPAIDSHDGSVPDLNKEVRTDHFIVYGSTKGKERTIRLKETWKEDYNLPEESKVYFPDEISAKYFGSKCPNQDFFLGDPKQDKIVAKTVGRRYIWK